MPLDARRYLRKMRGGAQAHLIECSDGNAYVVKFLNNPQHRRILVNELIASALLQHLQIAAPETALIRRINRAANEELEPADYRPLVRELLAHQTLSRRTGSPRLGLPPDVYPWAAELEGAWIEEVRRRGYDVVGDLDDLRGAPPPEEYADPDRPDEAMVSGAAVDALKALLLDNARLRRELGHRQGELDRTNRELERSYLRPTYRWRHKLVRRLEAGGAGQLAMRVYRRASGRSSRSA